MDEVPIFGITLPKIRTIYRYRTDLQINEDRNEKKKKTQKT